MPRGVPNKKKEEEVVEVKEENTAAPVVEEEKEVEEVVTNKPTGKFEAVKGSLIGPDGRVLESGLSQDVAEKKAERFNK